MCEHIVRLYVLVFNKLVLYYVGYPSKKKLILLEMCRFLLHALLDVPATFGEIASLILSKLCAMSSRVDLVCDTYQSPSIKDTARGRRGNNETSYTIIGPLQRSPKNCMKALHSRSFKTSLFRFLMHEWAEQANLDVLSGHSIYLALDQECYRYSIQDNQIVCEKINECG